MTRLFCVRAGDWMFQNWRLYRRREHVSTNGKIRWKSWDAVFSGRPIHGRPKAP